MMNYWEDNPKPAELPIAKREQWHREAWDKEQDALFRITHGAVAEEMLPHHSTLYHDIIGDQAA